MRGLIVALTLLIAPVCLADVDPLVPKPLPDSLEFDGVWVREIDHVRAIELAGESGRFALLHFTAEWCRPCKMMGRDVYPDASVSAWLHANALSIKIDVDEQNEVAEAFAVSAMPTIVLIRDGETADRITGARKADQFVEWLRSVEGGGGELAKIRQRAANIEDSPGTDLSARSRLASDALSAGLFDIATEQYLWLFDQASPNLTSSIAVGLHSMMWHHSVEYLIERHESARAAFTERRDALTRVVRSDGRKRISDLRAWLILNQVIGDDEAILNWLDEAKASPARDRLLKRCGNFAYEAVVAAERWEDVPLIVPEPVEEMQSMVRRGELTDVSTLRDAALGWTGEQYAGALASGNLETAHEIVRYALFMHDSPEMRIALIEYAIKSGAPTNDALHLMEEIEKAGHDAGDLRARLEQALGIGEAG
ncbi:MAG: thioredoxin domain-containing protein [Planctomycetota bacterium]